jgi:hypothetical protein
VTIATRGQTPDDFGDALTRRKVVRTNQDAMMEAFGNCYYDVVYDQIYFNPQDAKIALEAFGNRVKWYVARLHEVPMASADFAWQILFQP